MVKLRWTLSRQCYLCSTKRDIAIRPHLRCNNRRRCFCVHCWSLILDRFHDRGITLQCDPTTGNYQLIAVDEPSPISPPGESDGEIEMAEEPKSRL